MIFFQGAKATERSERRGRRRSGLAERGDNLLSGDEDGDEDLSGEQDATVAGAEDGYLRARESGSRRGEKVVVPR